MININTVNINKWVILNKVSHFVLMAILFITVVAVFVPLSPTMPSEGLDPSWVFGMNQGFAQGLSIGKELIFTLGPYGFIYTKSYHPSTDLLMLGSSFYFAFSYWLSALLFMRGNHLAWIVAFITVLAGLAYSPDALLFSYPLLVALLTFKRLNSQENTLEIIKHPYLVLILMFSPLGLLPLVKGSLIILCSTITGLCALLFIINKQYLKSFVCLVIPLLSMCLFWVISYQSLLNLPDYFINMAPIVSGYAEAMSYNGGHINEVLFFLASSALLLFLMFLQDNISLKSKLFLFLVFSVFLFLSFKGGFVRHDGHAQIASGALLMAGLLISLIIKGKTIFPILLTSIFTWAYIDSHHQKTSTDHFIQSVKSTYSTGWFSLKTRLMDKSWPKRDFDSSIMRLKEKANFPILQGTSDIYSFNQSYLIASGNSWQPRPILQSHCVYTPQLAQINKNFLLGAQAPDNILFSVEPIDGRLPSTEDGISWPVLLEGYEPNALQNDILFLKKKNIIPQDKAMPIISTTTHIFGDKVEVPHVGHPIFAEIGIKPSIFGKLANILFKPSQLQITINLKNGSQKQYRIISGMVKSGFIVSPLIESTAEFAQLYGDTGFLTHKEISSFEIFTSNKSNRFWNDKYTVTFKTLNTLSPINISKIFHFDEIIGNSKIQFASTECFGCIDSVNEVMSVPKQLSTSHLLKVSGWIVSSLESSSLPDAVFLVLSDKEGKHKLIKTRAISRPDVGAHFNKPAISECGYTSFTDVSELEGIYTLGIAIKQDDKIFLCPQFKIPTTIHKIAKKLTSSELSSTLNNQKSEQS